MNSKQLRLLVMALLALSGAAFAQKSPSGAPSSTSTGAAQAQPSSQAQAAVPIYGVTANSAPTGSSAQQSGTVPIFGVTTQAVQAMPAASQPAAQAIPGVTMPSISAASTVVAQATPVSQSGGQSNSATAVPGVTPVPGVTSQAGTSAQPAAPAAPAQPAASTGPASPDSAMNSMSGDKPQTMVADSTPQPTSANTTTVSDTSASTAAPALAERHPHYKINVGDQLNIKFEFLPNYSEATINVQPDGYVTLEGGVPQIYVLGKTQAEIEAAIRDAYKGLMKDPIVVDVELNSFLPPFFICWGQVMKPGKYEMKGDITLSQAVGIAGGYNSNAKHSHVVLFRRVGDQWVSAQVVNLKQMLYKANLSEDLHLQPGDMIWVPKNLVSKMQAVIPWNTFRMDYAPTGF